MRTTTTFDRAIKVILIAAMIILAAAIMMAAQSPASADLEGTSEGHAFSVGATVLGSPISAGTNVDLPPGGTTATEPINFSQLGVVVIDVGSSENHCEGVDEGPAVTASCHAILQDVEISVGGMDLLTADRIEVHSNSADSGSGASSNSTGTTFENVCVFDQLLAPCEQLDSGDNQSISLGLVTGSVLVDDQVGRATNGVDDGSGLTVTGIRISVSIVGVGALSIDLAQADSFVGGVIDNDIDGDGIHNDVDNCPSTPNSNQLDTDNDGQGDACDPDDDNDTVPDTGDNCPLVSNASQANNDGDALGDACDLDDDNDGIPDTGDNCPLTANSDQLDTDNDGTGDACDPDDDNDGVPDGGDNCPKTANAGQANNDGDSMGDACDPDDDNDGVPDTGDNCPLTANADQLDTDNDDIGDVCDSDDDNDTVPDPGDNCPKTANPGQQDSDSDGLGDACDTTPDDDDTDDDGVPDGEDNCPTIPNSNQADNDNDGFGDVCDSDDDNDGVPDSTDNCPKTANADQADGDDDGQGDACDTSPPPGPTEGEGQLWADADCSGEVNPVDSLKVLLFDAGLSVEQTQPCPEVGQEVEVIY